MDNVAKLICSVLGDAKLGILRICVYVEPLVTLGVPSEQQGCYNYNDRTFELRRASLSAEPSRLFSASCSGSMGRCGQFRSS